MKRSRLFILVASCLLGLVAVCWSRAQSPGHRLKVLDDKGVEVHTLMSDQYNALVGHLESAGQTNTLEMFRQYRCSYNADRSSSELGHMVAALQHLRGGRTNEAIRMLEQQVAFCVSMMRNSYGCLSQTNRERVKLESLEQARDYYARFPQPEGNASLEKTMNEVLRLAGEK